MSVDILRVFSTFLSVRPIEARAYPRAGGGGVPSPSSGTFGYACICLVLFLVKYLPECEDSAPIVRVGTSGTSLDFYQTSLHHSPQYIATAVKTSSPVMKIVSGKSWPQWGVYLAKRKLLIFLEQILGAFAKLRKGTISFDLSVRASAWNNSAPIGRIFMKFDTWAFFEKLWRKFKLRWSLIRVTGTLRGDLCTFMTVSCSFLLRMRYFSDWGCRENHSCMFRNS